MSAVGLAVELRVPPVLPMLPSAVELAAVRIVQEALTNVLVHAKASRAVVELEFGPDDQIRLAVHDNGSAGAPPTVPVQLLFGRPSRRWGGRWGRPGEKRWPPRRSAGTGWSGCGSGRPPAGAR